MSEHNDPAPNEAEELARRLENVLRTAGAETSPDELELGRIAVEWRLIDPAILDACLREREAARARGEDPPLGELLARRGLKNDDLLRVVKEQGRRQGARPNIPRYEIRSQLGEGATAVVYAAWDRELGRAVALKVLKGGPALSDVARHRFQREAKAAAGLSHPHVVSVHDAGEVDGQPFLVLELIEGRPLSSLLADGKTAFLDLVRLLEKTARGVAAAHRKGIVHRDLKPDNILVAAGGEPKVGDFGLAHVADAATELTKTGTALGTPLYMSPEQVRGDVRQISPRTDVYALGAILYEMATGRRPHAGDTVMEIYGKIVREDPVAPRRIRPDFSRDLETIILKAMDKAPARRYATADEFADELARFLAGEPVKARPPGPAFRLWRWGVRRRGRLAIAASLALAVVAVSFGRPASPAVEWVPVFDGRSLQWLNNLQGHWHQEGAVLVNRPLKEAVGQTVEGFADGDLRIRFAVSRARRLRFTARGKAFSTTFEGPALEALGPGEHVFVFSGRGPDVTAELDGRPVAVAADIEDQPVEVGVKFRSEVEGDVLGIRFFKGEKNPGPHVANLWSRDGRKLATAPFQEETASGWQQVRFAAPVPIQPWTTYVASYGGPSGGYACDSRYFGPAGWSASPLHALGGGTEGGNGVFHYGPDHAFPKRVYESSNYWVDVIFVARGGGPARSLWSDAARPANPSGMPRQGPLGFSVSEGELRIHAIDWREAPGVPPATESPPAPPRGPAPSLWPGLVAWWSFEQDGETIPDQSPRGNAGRAFGSARREPGVKGRALALDGQGAYVSLPRNAGFESRAFTLALWVKRDGRQSRNANLLRKTWNDNKAPVYTSWSVQFNHEGDRPGNVVFYTGYEGGVDPLESDWAVIPDQAWTHVAASYDPEGAAPQKKLFINGALAAQSVVGRLIRYDESPTGNVFIGQNGNGKEFFQGALDEIYVFSRALTPAEIQVLAAK